MATPARDAGLRILHAVDQEIEGIEHLVNQQFADQSINVLDAGCGRKWVLRLSMPYTITGIDADEAALSKRKDLDTALVGDMRTIQMPDNQFDLIYCSYVMEHVDGAKKLLMRFLAWLKPGGLLVLRFPDKYTVFGFITRKTPFWVHVAYRKYLREYRAAGEIGHGPYPTVYDEAVSRLGMWNFCRQQKLEVLAEWGVDTVSPKRGKPLAFREFIVQIIVLIICRLSMRKLASSYNNLAYVIRKP